MYFCLFFKKAEGRGERGNPGLCPGHCSLQNELPRGTASLLMPAGRREIGQGSSLSFQLGLSSKRMSFSGSSKEQFLRSQRGQRGHRKRPWKWSPNPHILPLSSENCTAYSLELWRELNCDIDLLIIPYGPFSTSSGFPNTAAITVLYVQPPVSVCWQAGLLEEGGKRSQITVLFRTRA